MTTPSAPNAVTGMLGSPGVKTPQGASSQTTLTEATPIPNRPPAVTQLGSAPQVLDSKGRPVIPPININTEQVSGIGQTATSMGADNVIDFVQNVRKVVVDGYLGQGVIPKATSDKLLFSGLLKDLADTELAKKKNESEAKNGAAAAMVAAILDAIPKAIPATVIPGSAPKALPDNIPKANMVPGEADTDPAQMDIDSFMNGSAPTGNVDQAPVDKKKKQD